MAVYEDKGMSDLFITLVANPKWPEIVTSLLANQKTKDRFDLVIIV